MYVTSFLPLPSQFASYYGEPKFQLGNTKTFLLNIPRTVSSPAGAEEGTHRSTPASQEVTGGFGGPGPSYVLAK